jgi:hypothetical protein
MITLPVCGSMLISVAFGREHILLVCDRLVLSGPDIPSGYFDPYLLSITRLSAPVLAGGDYFPDGCRAAWMFQWLTLDFPDLLVSSTTPVNISSLLSGLEVKGTCRGSDGNIS